MTYRGRVTKNVAESNELALSKFTKFYLFMGVFVLIISIIVSTVSLLWSGNIIFGVGSYIVYGSLLQNRYFDVKKNSNPSFADVQPNTFSPFWSKIELVLKHMWVVGSMLLFLSRWLKV